MNLVLLQAEELAAADGSPQAELTLVDRRAAHLLEVVRVTVGQRVRVGVIAGGMGSAEVVAVGPGRCSLRVTIDRPAPPRLPARLILAVPRPKVLLRTVAIAASFGVERIDLTNSWRVDKSYLGSPALTDAALARAARDGAEQGATCQLPEIAVHRRFMQLMERYPGTAREPTALFVVAHPGAPRPLERAVSPGEGRPVTIAVGPEGGWISRELDTFAERGFDAASLGPAILRVEAAIAGVLAQLQLLRRLPAARADDVRG